MLQEIYELLRRQPFRAFTVLTSDGHAYHVPTADHAGLNPLRTRLVIWTDNDEQYSLSTIHVTGIRSSHDAVSSS